MQKDENEEWIEYLRGRCCTRQGQSDISRVRCKDCEVVFGASDDE